MKSYCHPFPIRLAVFALSTAFLLAIPARADWLWDSTSKTLTDGNWVLKATLANGTELSVTGTNSAVSPATLNLRAPVMDADETAYQIVSVNGFANVVGLVDLQLPDALRTIGKAAFRGCIGLQSVSPLLPPGLVEFGGRAFSGCTNLQGHVVFPANTITINTSWDSAANGFFNGAKITSADMSAATFTEITGDSFSGCTNLEWVKLPDGLARIGSAAFWRCTSLTNVTPFLPPTVNYIGEAAFYCSDKLEGDLVIGNTAPVTLKRHGNNGYGLFEGTAIRSATLTAPSTTLSGSMFRNCKNLEWAILPDALESSAYGGDFLGCTSLTNVTPFLPSGMKAIGNMMFDGCTSLAMPLVLEGTNAITFNNTSWPGAFCFRDTKIPSVAITAPITQIGGASYGSTFAAMRSLHTIAFPETLTCLGANVLDGDTALTNVCFTGDCPTNLSNSAFSSMTDCQTRFFVPRNNSSWEDFRAERVEPIDESLRSLYREAYPGERLPLGVYPATTSRRLWYMLWTPPDSVLNASMILLR